MGYSVWPSSPGKYRAVIVIHAMPIRVSTIILGTWRGDWPNKAMLCCGRLFVRHGGTQKANPNGEGLSNIRELEHVIERAVNLSGSEIDLESLPPKVQLSSDAANISKNGDSRPTLDDMERTYVMEVLDSVDDDKVAAANILGIDLSTLYRKLKRYEPK